MFERFHRLLGTGEGSGLGLAISRAIAELHGGSLEAHNRPGRGAEFRLLLPRPGTD